MLTSGYKGLSCLLFVTMAVVEITLRYVDFRVNRVIVYDVSTLVYKGLSCLLSVLLTPRVVGITL